MTKKETYISFIEDELKSGNIRFTDVFSVFNCKFQKSERTFSKYWKIANERHLLYLQQLKEQKDAVSLASEVDLIQGKILTRKEREILATDIALGRGQKMGDAIVYPTVAEKLKAMDYLSRINKDYLDADTSVSDFFKKISVTVPDPINIPPPIRSEAEAKAFGESLQNK